jgi:hypothetical protein
LNGFGNYQIVDSLENPDRVMSDWHRIFSAISRGDIERANRNLENSAFSQYYQIVLLQDGENSYVLLREVLNNDYFDDNGTENEADDVRGSFDYGWGLFIFNLNPRTPEIAIELPHPCDDFITPYIGMDAFLSLGAYALFIAGAGREVKWNQVDIFDNTRSLSDPTRVRRSAFQQAHKVMVDSVSGEFILQIHSYDTDGRNLAPILLSTWPDNYPNRPVYDRFNSDDILNLTPRVPILANSIGNVDHSPVRVDDYYAIWNDGDSIYYQNELYISNQLSWLYGWGSPQRYYSFTNHDTLNGIENFMHIEHDELPNVINEEFLDFYPADGVPTYATYRNAVEFYRPLYAAIDVYFRTRRFYSVPDDYQSIQTAIDSVNSGDTVLVQNGVYRENVNFRGKSIVLASPFLFSQDPYNIDNTIIDGTQAGSVVQYSGGENASAKLIGFSIVNGRADEGAGLSIIDADPTISRCLIAGNTADQRGAAIYSSSSNFNLTNCTISGNRLEEGVGALWVSEGSAIKIFNTIGWGNDDLEVVFSGGGLPNRLTVDYSDIEGGSERIDINNNGEVIWTENNIVADPRFAQPDRGNFHLHPLSPCIDRGDTLTTLDPDHSRADMGAFSYNHHRIFPSTDTLNFIGIQPGSFDSLSLTLRNASEFPVEIISMEILPEATPFRLGTGRETSSIDPDSEFSLWVLFEPVDMEIVSADLVIRLDSLGEDTVVVKLHANPLSAGSPGVASPDDFTLESIYPNPFNGIATIQFSVPYKASLRLLLTDITGREIAELRNGQYLRGIYRASLNTGSLPAGIYFIMLSHPNGKLLKKALLLK